MFMLFFLSWQISTWRIFLSKFYVIVRRLPLILMTIAYFQIVRVLWRSDTIPGHSNIKAQKPSYYRSKSISMTAKSACDLIKKINYFHISLRQTQIRSITPATVSRIQRRWTSFVPDGKRRKCSLLSSSCSLPATFLFMPLTLFATPTRTSIKAKWFQSCRSYLIGCVMQIRLSILLFTTLWVVSWHLICSSLSMSEFYR